MVFFTRSSLTNCFLFFYINEKNGAIKITYPNIKDLPPIVETFSAPNPSTAFVAPEEVTSINVIAYSPEEDSMTKVMVNQEEKEECLKAQLMLRWVKY